MRIAAQLYTLRQHLKTPEDIAVTLKKVKEIGYNAVQVSGIGEIGNQHLKDLADQNGLTICATHVSYGQLTEQLDDVIEQHRIWDCKYVGLGGLPQHFRDSAEGYASFAKEANEIGKKLADVGMQFIYHNHHFEFIKYDGRLGMDILLEETDPEAVGFELDVYWLQAGGVNPVEWVRKVDGRMKVVHFKDMAISPKHEQLFAEVGEGNLNFKEIIQACESSGVEWAAVEQDDCYDKSPFDCLQTSFNNLRNMNVSD